MNADIFAEWMRRQGHPVFRSESSYWYGTRNQVLQAFPYHWVIKPTQAELDRLMLRHGILSLRYSTPLEANEGIASYHVVQCGPYQIENLRPQARNGIKRGLATFQIEPISFERMASEGWQLQCETTERQCRQDCMTQAEWQRMCLSACELPGFEAWGALYDGELAASIITTRIDDMFYVPYAQSRSKYLNKHVNNALFYVACQRMLALPGIAGIFFCLQSLDAPSSIDEFKFRMSFTPKPVRQRVVFNPLIQPFANQRTHRLVSQMLKNRPGSYLFSKAEGMLRFHLLGKQPLASQTWPECLQESKTEILQRIAFAPDASRETALPLATYTTGKSIPAGYKE